LFQLSFWKFDLIKFYFGSIVPTIDKLLLCVNS